MTRVIFSPTVADDLKHFSDRPPPYRIRWARTARIGNEVLGIGGIASLPDGAAVAFLELKPEARRYPVTLVKAAKLTLETACRMGVRRLVATADPAVESSSRFLDRLGFEATGEHVNGHAVYVWRPPA
jgi:RimJ/RimL family protein N-acetyltransferase